MDLFDAPSSQPRPPIRKLFSLVVFDDRHFALRFENDLTADEFTYAHKLVMGFPERKFRREYEAWLVAFAQANLDYLQSTFRPEEYSVDEEAKLIIEYHAKVDRSYALREQRRWQYLFEGKVPELKFDFATQPFKHQTVALDAIHGAEYFALLMETGTGKTKVVVDELRWSAEDHAAKGGTQYRVLVVCPKSVRGTWQREVVKHLPPKYPVWTKRVGSGVQLIRDLVEGVKAEAKLKVWVCPYDRLDSNLEALEKMAFDLVVLDESTRIKSPGAKRSKAARQLGTTAMRRIILTGTPIGNNVLDLWSQFQFLQPGCLGFDVFNAFKQRYARVKKVQNWEKIEGWQNIDELKARMARCSFVVKKAQCLDLPAKVYSVREVAMGSKQRALYDDMLENFIASLGEDVGPEGTVKAQIVLTKLLRLSQISSGFIKPIEGEEKPIPDGDVKLEALGEVLDEADPDTKAIVWCRFQYDVRQIRDYLRNMKIQTVEIHGSVRESDRERAIESFNSDWGARVLIGEPGSGGEGLTLLGSDSRPCTNAIYFSNDFSLLKRLQSEDRCHRIGTKRPVTYTDICCEDSVDQVILARLQGKKDLMDMLRDYASVRRLLLACKGNGDD